MPPRLKNGRPTQTRRYVVPSRMVLCQCSECICHKFYDLTTDSVVSGQNITYAQHRTHIGLDQTRRRITENFMAEGLLPRWNQNYSADATPSKAEQTDAPEKEPDTDTSITPPPPQNLKGQQSFSRRKRAKIISKKTPTNSTSILLSNVKEYLETLPSESFRESVLRTQLDFLHPPENHLEGHEYHSQTFDLHPDSSKNNSLLNHENTLRRYLEVLESIQGQPRHLTVIQSVRIKILIPKVKEHQYQAFEIKRECWEYMHRLSKFSRAEVVETAEYFAHPVRDMEPITALVFLLTSALHFFSFVSLADIRNLVLPMLQLLIKLAMYSSRNPERTSIASSIPSDVRTVLASLHLEPETKRVVCCPKCFATYAFDPHDPLSFPEFCTYKDTKNSGECKRRLRTGVPSPNGLVIPTRQFLYQDIRHWIARMYSRPDIEDAIDKLKVSSREEPEELTDMWDGSVLREFKGPDGLPYMKKPKLEGRLVFGLNMDGFNPYGNKEAGKHLSICGIYLVCLNLPIDIRYKMENVFLLGVVPGPHEPSTHEVNHLLRPLVDDLLQLWEPGMFLSQTARHPKGRRITCALIPIIADLPAARRVAGLGGHSATFFCSECLLELDDIHNLESNSWTPRDYESHCQHARAWRDAATQAERTRKFREYGSKWSELLRLPYWDPTKFVVIDSMHGFYLRMFQRHIRDVWGMNTKFSDQFRAPDIDIGREKISQAYSVLEDGSKAELDKLHLTQLQYLCRENGYHYGGKKSSLIKTLVQHRIDKGWFNSDGLRLVDPTKIASSSPLDPKSSPNSPPPAAENLNQMCQENNHIICPTSSQPEPTQSSLASNGIPDVSQKQTQIAGLHAQLAQKIAELEDLYRSNKTTIQTTRKETLVSLCVLKFKGTPEEYNEKTLPELRKLIHESRFLAGLTDENGKLIKSTKSTHSPPSTPLDSVSSPNANAGDTPSPAALLELYQTGSTKKLRSTKRAFLLALCAVKFGAQVAASYKKSETEKIMELLHEKRTAEGIIVPDDDDDDDVLASNAKSKSTNALGQQTLEQIQLDMDTIVLPSWFNKAPKHPGDVKWGKFKADEWKAFCTVNLPVTLGRLWGSKPKDDKRYQMFENFMYLVAAVRIATMRVINSRDIALYEQYIKLYLTGFIKLYPWVNITPYQHLSLHFSTHLRRFGPTHSWRCFAFERYNGIIQNTPSNSKFGDLEESKFLRFCRLQNLRTLFASTSLPPELDPIVSFYEQRFQIKIRGTLLEELGRQNQTFRAKKQGEPRYPDGTRSLDNVHIEIFRNWIQAQPSLSATSGPSSRPILLSYIELFGRRYQPGSGGNSYVLFTKSDQHSWAPGRIVSIMTLSHDEKKKIRGQTYVILKSYLTLSEQDAGRDHYRRIPHCGYLVYDELEPDFKVIPISGLMSHFACTAVQVSGIDKDCLHVLPLSL